MKSFYEISHSDKKLFYKKHSTTR